MGTNSRTALMPKSRNPVRKMNQSQSFEGGDSNDVTEGVNTHDDDDDDETPGRTAEPD